MSRRTDVGLHRKRSHRVGYQVRLDLLGAKPPIWRRLDLPSDLMLDELHEVILTAMGWDGFHMHAFSLGSGWNAFRFPPVDPFGAVVEDGFSDGPPEDELSLDQVLHEVGDTVNYDYDFGDSWEHRLKLEKVLDRQPDDDAVRLITGKRACPPEDCGGVYAYNFYQSIAQALVDGEPVDDNDLEQLRYFWPTETPQQILAAMATFDADSVAARLSFSDHEDDEDDEDDE